MIQTVRRSMKRLLGGIGLASAVLVAGCGGGDQGRDPVLGLPAASIVSVAVAPTTASVAIGASQQFTATAAYSDGTARDITRLSAWTSATPAAGTVDGARGVAVGVAAGTSIITAAFEGKSGSATLTVLPAKLVSIAVAPVNPSINIGNSQQFVALGTFDNNTTRDISAVSTFSSASTGVASISSTTGLALGKMAGTSVIGASSGGLTGSATLTVLPPTLVALTLTPDVTNLQIGATGQLLAIATYSDGSVVDVTGTSSYVSASPAMVGVGSTGLLTGVSGGSSVITVNFGGKSATATATTAAATANPAPVVTVTSIAVSPTTANVLVNGRQQYIARATYSNNTTAIVTTSATWTSSATVIATVLPTGLATGASVGNVIITATLGGQSGNANLTVSAPLPGPVVVLDPVQLRSASTFAVLARTSLTSNAAGTTLITGNVGSPSQTTTPTIAAGFTSYQSGAILQTALDDLNLAIAETKLRACTTEYLGNIDLGGLTLAPGVYCASGTINITGKLTLNGPGVFILRTAQTLDSAANSEVAFTNGATADNLTWLPVGATTIGANSVFKGTILSEASAITVGDNATLLNGRVLSNAAVTLSNNQITK
jgi:ribosomal protein L21E